MSHRFRKYEGEEFTRRGDALYRERVEPTLKKSDRGKFVAIDIDSGDFKIHADQRAAAEHLQSLYENPQIWMVRVGSRYVRHFGGRAFRSKS